MSDAALALEAYALGVFTALVAMGLVDLRRLWREHRDWPRGYVRRRRWWR